MALNSWMLRRSKLRSGRYRRSSKQSKQEDILASLANLDPHESFRTLLKKICEKDVEEPVLYERLNAFLKLTLQYETEWDKIGFKTEELLCCLRISLTHESILIRTAGLRCIRHVLKNENDIVQLNKLLIPYLLTRSLELILSNEAERIEAMKLIRKSLILAPSKFDTSLARCLVALAYEDTESKDRMLRVCLATLSELGVLNPRLFIITGGVSAISRNLIECQTPKIAESLCGVLLLLLDKPSTRQYAAVDLHGAAAPFCDFHYKQSAKDQNKRDERELRLNCARLTLLTILRSWSGILHFCSPNDRAGFKSIVDILYLNQLEVRKSVLDLLYELLGLPQPEWSDELSVALSAVDPCEPQAAWRLNEGFVVAEGRSVLPHLAKTTPSTADMHLALLLYCFLENGLLAALTEVIATSDTFICVRASVLLGELLRLIQVLLPPGCCNISPSLPSLLKYATESKPQAIAAVTALEQLHMLMKKRPASYSLHLDYIIRNSYHKRFEYKQEKNKRHKNASILKHKLHQLVLKDGDDAVKETGVLSSNDASTWDWNLINLLLKGENNAKINLHDTSHRSFIKKLVEFYMPSKKKYSHMDLGTSRTCLVYTTAGVELINFLVEVKESESSSSSSSSSLSSSSSMKPLNLILDLFKDIMSNIDAISTSRSVHDCLFSPQHMVSTQCQSYFLFIGQFSRTDVGLKVLENISMFAKLKELATTTIHDCYVKLIISSLEYILPGPCRDILEAVLTCKLESSRLYATQFLHVLLRARNPLFSTWAIQLLVNQLHDKSRSVYLSALATLHEACELPDCLEALININPNLDRLGEKGTLLFIRFLSTESGYDKVIHDSSREKIMAELQKWDDYFCCRYVKLVEGDLSDTLTLHQRNEDGRYDKRASSLRNANKREVFLPPHIYGQLNQHTNGFKMLISNERAEKMIEVIKKAKCSTEEDIIRLKAAIWAIAHLGTSNIGFDYLTTYGAVDYIVDLAMKSTIYSIRATVFYALGLLGTTPVGADDLSRRGWLCTRHDRHDNWPIIQEEIQEGVVGLFGNPSMSTSEDAISLDNAFGGDFEITEEDDEDDVDHDESQDFMRSLISSPENRRLRQSSLPMNKRQQQHKRTLSESKTFDVNNGFDEENRSTPLTTTSMSFNSRQRNSSMTESTTSGISSCDSLANKHGTCVSYLKTLSPIPSSSSLSTLQVPAGPFRRISHRISSNSTTNSDISSSSLTGGSTPNELSIQNLRGYNTLKYLRLEGLKYDKPTYEVDYLFKLNPMSPNTSLVDDFKAMEALNILQPSTLFSVSKLDVVDTPQTTRGDKRYMGISLPRNLSDFFPTQEEIQRVPYIFPESGSSSSNFSKSGVMIMDAVPSTSKASRSSTGTSKVAWKHAKMHCFRCCANASTQNSAGYINDDVKLELLKNIERLANPTSVKLITAHLIRFKQHEPEIFKDVCIYSEVCKMFTENVYRLSTRRMLHELFLDVAFTCLHDEAERLLMEKDEGSATNTVLALGNNNIIKQDSIESPPQDVVPNSDRDRRSISSDISSPTDSVKTLDSLKLTFNENKFPIRPKKK